MEATYSEAVAICEAEGARLCSVTEVESDCTRGSGCLLDAELIWTSGDCSADENCTDVNACNYNGVSRNWIQADQGQSCSDACLEIGNFCIQTDISCDNSSDSYAPFCFCEDRSMYYVGDNCEYGVSECADSSDQAEECDPNAGYSLGYDDAVASVTPDDGIGQSDVDVAYAAGIASVTPEDGINQATVDAAVAIEFAAAYILGAQSGDINNSGFLNVSDIIMYIEKIVSE